MPWRLADDEPTVRIEFKLPASMKKWLEQQAGSNVGEYLRSMIRRSMGQKKGRSKSDLVT